MPVVESLPCTLPCPSSPSRWPRWLDERRKLFRELTLSQVQACHQTRVTRRLTSTLLPSSGHLTLGQASSPLTLSSVKGDLWQHSPPVLPVLKFVPWTLLGPVAAWALWPGIQGCESVAELVPDFLVKPLILLNACFCFFQVVVLGPLCRQPWAFPAPAAQPRCPPPSRPLSCVAFGEGTGRAGTRPRVLCPRQRAEGRKEPVLSFPEEGYSEITRV